MTKAPSHWPPTPEREATIRRVLHALADAREAAGWPASRLHPTTPLARERHGHVALRLHELEAAGEDAERLLVAVFCAKVHEHRHRDGEHGRGTYATAVSPLRDTWWDASLAAGRAWLAAGGRPAATTTSRRGGAYVSRGEYNTV